MNLVVAVTTANRWPRRRWGEIGLQRGFDEIDVEADWGQHLFWCVLAVLGEQPSKHRQVFGRCGPGQVWSADELDHPPGVGRAPGDVLSATGMSETCRSRCAFAAPVDAVVNADRTGAAGCILAGVDTPVTSSDPGSCVASA
jgi:hypothetical protein